MSVRISPGLVALVLVAACGERVPPTAVDESGPALARSATPATEQPRLERLARRMARALADPAFRARVKAELDRSPFVEHKLHFQRFLTAGAQSALAEVARLNAEPAEAVGADALGAVALELYLPVPEHRARWHGGPDVLVATAIHDRDVPIAYDVRGRRSTLSPDTPPATPVLALVPAETSFDPAGGSETAATSAVCPLGTGPISAQCDSGGGGTATTPGLWMTYASFTQTFEGWLKGSPEFEIHILGQAGSSDSLKSYQCAGEHAGGPYETRKQLL